MYDAAYWASMGVDDPVDFANSASPYMDSGMAGEMEGLYGGGYADPGMAYMDAMGAMGSLGAMGGRPGIPPAKLLSLMTNAAGGVKSGSPFGIPGQFQMPPDRDLSHKADDPNQMGLRGRQGGVVRPGVTPAGLAQKPGPVVKNNYPRLNGLMNKAQGTYYA